MGDDLTIVNSARVSFGVTKDKLDNRDKKLIKYLVKHRHTSTFEHNVVTFRFVVPMFVRSQHMRHRSVLHTGVISHAARNEQASIEFG
jgi:thymidylate synthase (FAD)